MNTTLGLSFGGQHQKEKARDSHSEEMLTGERQEGHGILVTGLDVHGGWRTFMLRPTSHKDHCMRHMKSQ